MKQADLIWMNGEFVKWEDAKVHVLTHGLHYGTGVFEGIRCYDTEIGPAVFRHLDHIDRLFKSAELYYMPIPFDRDAAPAGDARASSPRNGMRSCYIRPIVFRGYGTMGLFPLDAPVDVTIAVWEWGSYLGDEGKANGIRAKVSSWRRISPDSLIPHAKALGPVPELDPREDRVAQGRLRGGDPPRRQGLRLRGLGREHLRRARRADRHAAADRVDPRRHQPQVDHPDRARPRLRGRRARPRARRAVPRRRGVRLRHGGRADAAARDRRPRGRRRPAGRDHARGPGGVRGRPARAQPSATASGSTRSPCRRAAPQVA